MVRNIICIWSLLFVVSGVYGYTLEGHVYGPNDEVLEDVLVQVLDENRTILGRDYTGKDGEYRIFGLPEGRFTVEAKKHGLTTYNKEIHLTGASNNEILKEDIRYAEANFQVKVKSNELIHLYLPSDYQLSSRAHGMYQKGMKAYNKAKFKKAGKWFEKALKIDPSFSRAYLQLALSLQETGDDKNRILELIGKAVKSNPGDPVSLMHLAKYEMEENNYNKACDTLMKALAIDPNIAEVNLLLGKAYYRKGQHGKAEYYLTQGILLDPDQARNFRITLANMYIQQDRLTDARDQFKQYLRENPYSQKQKEIKQMIDDLEKRIAIYKMEAME